MSDLRRAVEALEDELQCRSVVVSDDNDDGRIEERADILKRIRALLAVPEPPREELRGKVECLVYHAAQHSDSVSLDQTVDAILALLPEETGLSHPPEREETRLLCDTPFDDEVWRCEACGDEWVFTDGTPEQNHMEYCHACGRKIVAIVRPEPEEDEEEEDTP